MSKLLEILGRAITVDTAELIWHWLHAAGGLQGGEAGIEADEFERILDHLGNMELDRAEEKINFLLFERPDDVAGRMAAAAVHLHRDDLDAAMEHLEFIYRIQPSNTLALYALGYCHERQDAEDKAVEFYQDCIKFKGHLQLPRQRMGAIYFKNGRLDRAIEQYEALITEHPDDITSMVLLGYLYIEDRQYDRAVDVFNMAIVSHPDNFHEQNDDEDLRELCDQGEFDRAIENVEWLMDKVGEMPDLHVKLGDILSRAGRPSEAIVHYEQAIRLQPSYLEATIKLGTHYLRFQRCMLAAEQFNRAAEINDEIVDAYVGLAISQNLAGDTEQTYRTLSLASAIQQNSTLLFSETATLHLQSALAGRHPDSQSPEKVVLIEDVIRAHQSQMRSTPRSADIHYKVGMLMMVVGDPARAVECFRSALTINPTHFRARTKLALCLCEIGREQEATVVLAERAGADPALVALHYRIAVLYCDRRRFARALTNLDRLMADTCTQPDAMVNVEVVLENLGLIDRAVATWDRLTQTANNAIVEGYK